MDKYNLCIDILSSKSVILKVRETLCEKEVYSSFSLLVYTNNTTLLLYLSMIYETNNILLLYFIDNIIYYKKNYTQHNLK